MLGKKPMVSALPLNNNLGLGERSPSLSLGVYYNSIRVDKNISISPSDRQVNLRSIFR